MWSLVLIIFSEVYIGIIAAAGLGFILALLLLAASRAYSISD